MVKKVAIIPLRAGSKGIPNKNKKKLFGRPLYQWVLSEAIFSNLDEIYVYTDDEEIISYISLEYKWTDKLKALRRSKESATDTASTEQTMLEFSQSIEAKYDFLCLLQATSPLTTRNDINACIDKVVNDGFDSALTVVNTKRFYWTKDGQSINYDYLNRPRRQDFDGQFVENGAAYIISKEAFLKNNNRLGGKIALVEMPEDTYMEIDELSDWYVVEKLIENRLFLNKRNPGIIKAIVFDVDGVFTDGTVAVSADMELFKQFSLRDGMGFEILKDANIIPIVITSENSEIVRLRMKKLQISNIYLGVKDKYSRLENILSTLRLNRNEVAYVGDDVNDLPNIASVAWGIVPSNAILKMKYYADMELNNKGGDLAIREAIDFIIKYNTKYTT